MPSSSSPSNPPTKGTLTLTIKYTCQGYSEELSRSFLWSWLTKHRTSRRLTMRCLTSLQGGVLSLLVIPGSQFMVFEEQSKGEWRESNHDLTWSEPTSPSP